MIDLKLRTDAINSFITYCSSLYEIATSTAPQDISTASKDLVISASELAKTASAFEKSKTANPKTAQASELFVNAGGPLSLLAAQISQFIANKKIDEALRQATGGKKHPITELLTAMSLDASNIDSAAQGIGEMRYHNATLIIAQAKPEDKSASPTPTPIPTPTASELAAAKEAKDKAIDAQIGAINSGREIWLLANATPMTDAVKVLKEGYSALQKFFSSKRTSTDLIEIRCQMSEFKSKSNTAASRMAELRDAVTPPK